MLKNMTTTAVGGDAARTVTASTEAELIAAITAADNAGEDVLFIGGGSNLVISDAGFSGTVIRIATRGLVVEEQDGGLALLRAAAGENWDATVEYSLAEGLSGLEALSGIPGCAGATPVQNVGAYGQDVSQTIARVRVWDRDAAAVRTFTASECEFSYRHSRFKGAMDGASPRYVVLEVLFQLEIADLSKPIAYADLARGLGVELGARVPLADARQAVLEQRHKRGMVLDAADHDTWSCGSFFTNPILSTAQFEALRERVAQRLGPDVAPPGFPGADDTVKSSAAWLIDRAGFGKGYGMPGPAALSTKHTLALTNRGDASADDLLALARHVRDGVQEAFGVRLVNEPVLVGLTL